MRDYTDEDVALAPYAKRALPVQARQATEAEQVTVSWSDQLVTAAVGDWIVTDGTDEWTVGEEIFDDTYVALADGGYMKTAGAARRGRRAGPLIGRSRFEKSIGPRQCGARWSRANKHPAGYARQCNTEYGSTRLINVGVASGIAMSSWCAQWSQHLSGRTCRLSRGDR